MDQITLSLEDVNCLIQFFAISIQNRIEQIQLPNRISIQFSSEDKNGQSSKQQNIIQKYIGYASTSSLQLKLFKKFTERIIQIFIFFKEKSKSIISLSIFENKIKSKFDQYLTETPVKIGQALNFVYNLTKKGELMKLHFQRKKSVRKRLKQCPISVKMLSSYNHSQNQRTDQKQVKQKNAEIKQKNTFFVDSATINSQADSHQNSYHLSEGIHLKQLLARPQTGKPTNLSQKRFLIANRSTKNSSALSSMSQSTKKHKISISRINSSFLQFHNQQSTIEPFKRKSELIENLYIGMNVDGRYIERIPEKMAFIQKDILKRNEKILNKLKKQTKKSLTNLNNESIQVNSIEAQHNIGNIYKGNRLKSISQCISDGLIEPDKLQTFKNILCDLNYGNYRVSIRNHHNKNYSDKRKRIQSKYICKTKQIENKQN